MPDGILAQALRDTRVETPARRRWSGARSSCRPEMDRLVWAIAGPAASRTITREFAVRRVRTYVQPHSEPACCIDFAWHRRLIRRGADLGGPDEAPPKGTLILSNRGEWNGGVGLRLNRRRR